MTKLIYFLFVLSAAVNAQYFTNVTGIAPAQDVGDSRAVNWIDYDNDGDLDLYITNGPQSGENNFFYENNGDGTFTKITSIAIAQDGKASDGSSWGDYDNDGYLDLFVANWWNQNNLLYRNNGDKTFTFQNINISAEPSNSETGSWNDFDKDGDLDLYVCNSYSPTLRNYFYINNGDGTFTKAASGSLVTDQFFSRNADWADYDNDGWVDLFVPNEENQKNNLYKNNGDGTFTKITAGDIVNDAGNSTGSSWGDYDNDGDYDLIVCNWKGKNFLYNNNGDGTFTKVMQGEIVTDTSLSFGSVWGDIDNDGDLDLYIANAFSGSPVNNYLYINNGDGTFTRNITDASVTGGGWSYGAAMADYNNDGYLDLAVGKCFGANEANAIFKNNGGSNRYLLMDLKGVISNRSAIGTEVKVKAVINGNPVWQLRQVSGQTGYCGQALQLHFGLGSAEVIDSIIIEWPSGIIQVIDNVNSNQTLTVTEDSTLLGLNDNLLETPSGYRLEQNFPNPFNPSTKIKYIISNSSFVNLKIYDVLGNEVATLVNEEKSPGEYEAEFSSEGISSGTYIYTLKAGNFFTAKKLILMK